jgi:hypothetical protein
MPKTVTRSLSSLSLITQLKKEGRLFACEVCGILDSSNLEIHHIMPVAINPNNLSSNLVILCKNHHALVEKYYWWERSKLLPKETKELRQLAILFSKRKIPSASVTEYQARTKELWLKLNNHAEVQNFFWWLKCFESSKTWALTQEVFREVTAKDAIIEDPWFRLKTL